MLTDTEIKLTGIQALIASLGKVDAERFIALIRKRLLNYTAHRQAAIFITAGSTY